MKCDVCGKRRMVANKVSHSNIKTKTSKMPNIQRVKAVFSGRVCHIKACTRCIRSGRVAKAA